MPGMNSKALCSCAKCGRDRGGYVRHRGSRRSSPCGDVRLAQAPGPRVAAWCRQLVRAPSSGRRGRPGEGVHFCQSRREWHGAGDAWTFPDHPLTGGGLPGVCMHLLIVRNKSEATIYGCCGCACMWIMQTTHTCADWALVAPPLPWLLCWAKAHNHQAIKMSMRDLHVWDPRGCGAVVVFQTCTWLIMCSIRLHAPQAAERGAGAS